MAEDRKIFPIEQVLELVTGKEGADTSNIVAFITGRSNLTPEARKAAAPFAFSWLASWYPRFMDMEYKDDQTWEAYLRQMSHMLGDKVSLAPMNGRLKNIVNQALDVIEENQAACCAHVQNAVKLDDEIKRLTPLQKQLETAQKKNDELEAKIKSMKTEMNALNRKLLEFEGKIPMDQEELMQTISDTIKNGLKGLSVAAAAASAATNEAAGMAEAAVEEVKSEEEEWGFGSSSSGNDEFGF